DTCKQDPDGSAGLSAVQIGELKRVFVINKTDDRDSAPDYEIVINPTLEIVDKKPSKVWEGCLSIGEGDKRLFARVTRPRKVKINYTDRDGKPKELTVKGFQSHL